MMDVETRSRIRSLAVAIAVTALLLPPLIALGRRLVSFTLLAIPPGSMWAPAASELADLALAVPVAALGIAYILRPDALGPAYWVLPLTFLMLGVADALVALGGPRPLPGHAQLALIPALPALALALLLWVLRPGRDDLVGETEVQPDREEVPTG